MSSKPSELVLHSISQQVTLAAAYTNNLSPILIICLLVLVLARIVSVSILRCSRDLWPRGKLMRFIALTYSILHTCLEMQTREARFQVLRGNFRPVHK